jgi:predicted nucleic-acid-binding Zn-ribbon protein
MSGPAECTKCGGTEFKYFDSVDDLGMMNAALPMALDHEGRSGKPCGRLEAYACTRCGLVEFYVADVSELR